MEDEHAWNLMLIGKTGHGKSSTGNSILSKEDFLTNDTSTAVTYDVQFSSTRFDGQIINVIDTPGLCDTSKMSEGEMVISNVTAGMSMCPSGVDCFLFVLSFASPRFTDEEMSTFHILKEVFTQSMFEKFCVVVFTYKDVFQKRQKKSKKPESFLDWCKRQGGGLRELLKLCQYRCLSIDNEDPSEEDRQELVSMIRNMRAQREQPSFTNELFTRALAAHKKLVEEAEYPTVSADVMQQLALLRDELHKALDCTDETDGGTFLIKLDAIKESVEELLFEIEQLENTSGILDPIAKTIKDFIDYVASKANAKEFLEKLQDSELRKQMFKVASITSGALTAVGTPSIAAATSFVACNPITAGVAAGATAGVGVLATGCIAIVYVSEKRKEEKQKQRRERAKELRKKAEKKRKENKQLFTIALNPTETE